ncbi:MAG TPA: beta-galactosidase [Candidatus Thermoplasmatota archaeon]|nr:beta-galactosidase [Candidatus Thermoplasmatota archaeon]
MERRASEERIAVLVALLAVALVWWVADAPGPEPPAIAGAILAGAAWRALGPARRRLATASGLFLASAALDAGLPAAPLALHTKLLLVEPVVAALPTAAVVVALSAVLDAGGRRSTLVVPLLALVLGGAGTAIRIAEAAWLDAPATTAEQAFAILRSDAAYALWGLAAAVGAAWAGTHLIPRDGPFAGPGARPAAAAFATAAFLAFTPLLPVLAPASPGPLIVGIHTDDVASVDASSFPFVHLEIAWSDVERSPGRFDWARADRAMSAAVDKGLEVYLLLNTYPPDWVARSFPDGVMMDAQGRPFHWVDRKPGDAPRVWDMSFHHEATLAMKERFLREAARRFADLPGVMYVSIQNEPSYPRDIDLTRIAGYDPFSLAAWREARAGLGVGADAAPRGPGDANWTEWQRFREDSLIAFVERQVATVRAETAKPVTVKIESHFLTRFTTVQSGLSPRVVAAFVEMSDVVSVDLYPATLAELEGALSYHSALADGKPLVVSEFNLLLGKHEPNHPLMLARALRLVAAYADHVVLFTLDDHPLYELTGRDLASLASARGAPTEAFVGVATAEAAPAMLAGLVVGLDAPALRPPSSRAARVALWAARALAALAFVALVFG